MNEQWQDFLQQQGAVIENGVVTEFTKLVYAGRE